MGKRKKTGGHNDESERGSYENREKAMNTKM